MTTIAVTGQALCEVPIGPPDAGMRALLAGADALFANLEATVAADGAWPTKTKTVHAAVPAVVRSLAGFGITDLGHANNHAFDIGPPGIAAARAAAAAAGLTFTGSGADLAEAGRPAVRIAGGRRLAVVAADCGPQGDIVYAGAKRAGINPLRIRRELAVSPADFAVLSRILAETGEGERQAGRAAVGFRDGIAAEAIDFYGLTVRPGSASRELKTPLATDLDRIRRQLDEAKAAADIVVVSLHHHWWEPAWGTTPEWFLKLSQELVEQGADIVAGTGTPVLQPVTFHRGRPIFGSLGNLIFHTGRLTEYDEQGHDVWSGAICLCRFAADGDLAGVDVAPVAVGRPGIDANGLAAPPSRLTGAAAKAIFERMAAGLSGEDRKRLRLAPG